MQRLELDHLLRNNRGKRTNQRQKHILYAAMAMNRKTLERRSGGINTNRAKQTIWKKLTVELNRAGPKKDESQWRKVWTDLRLGFRKKWDKAQQGLYSLNEYETRVINFCGMLESSGVENQCLNSDEDVNSFFEFLQREELRDNFPLNFNSTEGFTNENSNSSEIFVCQETLTDEFDGEQKPFFEEPSIDISDDDYDCEKPNARTEDIREKSIECISDDEVEITQIKEEIRSENLPPNLDIMESGHLPEVEEIQLDTNAKLSTQLYCPPTNAEVPTTPTAVINMNLCRIRKKVKNSTLKEIRKMHRNLLKESKKQTALLRKLVQGMQS